MNKNKELKQTVTETPIKTADFFEKMGDKTIFLVLGILSVIAFIVFKDFIFFKKVYLYKDIASDSLNASWPFMVHTADYLAKDGFPTWSFNFGMGQNMSTFGFYDPIDVILYALGKSNMAYLLIWKELFKIIVAGLLFFKFLKLLNLNNFTCLIGALLYGFSGYMIVGSAWFLFSFEAFVLALLLWSFEQFLIKNKWYWMPLPIFLIGVSRPFNFWLFGIFLLIYAVLRIYQTQSKRDAKTLGVMTLKLAGLVLLGIGLCAPLFLDHVQAMIDSPRGSGPDSYFKTLSSGPMFKASDKNQFGTAIMRFFSSDILQSGINFKGWGNYLEAPAFYCGLISLLLFPQVFQFLEKKLKRVFAIILAIWLLPIIFPYFRQALWIFSGDYYRAYSIFVGLIIIVFAMMALHHIVSKNKISVKLLLATLGVLIVFLNYPFFSDKTIIDSKIYFLTFILLITYSLLLYFIGTKPDTKSYKITLLLCMVIELSYFSWCTVNRRDNVMSNDLKQTIGYNDNSKLAVNYLKQIDNSFYRIDKSYSSTPAIHGSLNDALVFNYFGTSCYNSFNQINYINYFKTTNVISKVSETESRWAPGLINRFMLETLNGVKYIMTKDRNNPVWLNAYDSINKLGDVIVLKNKNFMPIGFAYSKYMKLSDFDLLSPIQKDVISTKACIINDEEVTNYNGLTPYNLKDTLALNLLTFDLIKANFDSLKTNTFKITNFKQTNIKGEIALPSSKMVYFSIPFDKGWHVTEGGKELEKVMLTNGMTGLYLDKGNHAIEFNFVAHNLKRGMIVAIISLLVFLGLLGYFKFKKNSVQKI